MLFVTGVLLAKSCAVLLSVCCWLSRVFFVTNVLLAKSCVVCYQCVVG